MELKNEYRKHMLNISPAPEDLPGDLGMIHYVLEKALPGDGMTVVLHIAQKLRTTRTYWAGLRRASKNAMKVATSQEEVDCNTILHEELESLETAQQRAVSNVLKEILPDTHLQVTLRLIWAFRGTTTIWHCVDKLYRSHRDDWLRNKFDRGGITYRALSRATAGDKYEIGERQLMNLLNGRPSRAQQDRRQLKLWNM